MLSALRANAERLVWRWRTELLDAERLPFAGEELSDLVSAMRASTTSPTWRVPSRVRARARAWRGAAVRRRASRYGDRLRDSKARAAALAPCGVVRSGARAALSKATERPTRPRGLRRRARVRPGELARAAGAAGFVDVRITGEELLANWFVDQPNARGDGRAGRRAVGLATVRVSRLLLLQGLDRRLLESRLPPAIFYNLLISARKPRGG